MSGRTRPVLAAVLLLVWGCAGLRSSAPEEGELPAPASAWLSVDVWQGFTALPGLPLPEAPHVVLVVDLTRSMRTARRGEPLRLYGAREAAAGLVERLPDEATVDVHVLGMARRGACEEATRVASGGVAALRQPLASQLRRMMPEGEGSLAETLGAIARARAGSEQEARVVAFTDLDASCGGDLCAAAEALVASGVQLELVLFGPEPAPACLAGLSASPSRQGARLEAPKPLRFRVLDAESGSARARGRADGQPLAVPMGAAMLLLETEPPTELGPLPLERDTHTRVRLLDFPTLKPPVREWRWSVQPGSPDGAPEEP